MLAPPSGFGRLLPVAVRQETEKMRLYFEQRNGGGYRGNWLLLGALRFGANTELMFHWQRTRTDGVVFDDRVLIARQVNQGTEATLN
jgi:hypothetical protein